MSDPVETPLHTCCPTCMKDGSDYATDTVCCCWNAWEPAMSDPVEDTPLDAAFLDGMAAWSIDTFGPGTRLDGVLDHMAKEIEEARAKPDDVSEWADLAILAFDGAQRQGITGQQFIDAWRAKFAKNRSRSWPDWRTAEPGKAIEHDRASDE